MLVFAVLAEFRSQTVRRCGTNGACGVFICLTLILKCGVSVQLLQRESKGQEIGS